MIESIHLKEIESLDLCTRIEGYYIEENPKSLRIRLPNGSSFWVPKRFVDTEFSRKNDMRQIFIIDTWILRKIGMKI